MNYKQEFKRIKKELGLTYEDIAKITGHTPASVRVILQPNKEFPRWMKLAVHMYMNKPVLFNKEEK